MRLTRLGRSAVAGALSLLSTGALLSYAPAVIAGALMLSIVAVDLLTLRATLAVPSYLEPAPARLELSRGTEAMVRLRARGRRPHMIKVRGRAPRELGPGLYEVAIKAGRAGLVEVSAVEAVYRSPLRLLEFADLLPLRPRLSLVVHPSSLPAITTFLSAGGKGLSLSGSPMPPLVGPGEEYAFTDELRPGEPANRVDWRATARIGRPMIKRFYAEWATSASLVVDLTATDDVSVDELAQEASILLYALRSSSESRFYLYDGERLLKAPGAQEVALELLRALGRYYPEVNRILDDLPGLRPSLEESSAVEGPRVIALTQLLSALPSLLPPRCVIVQPTRPWVWAPSIEDAYTMRVRHDRARALAEAAGCRVFRRATEALSALGLMTA